MLSNIPCFTAFSEITSADPAYPQKISEIALPEKFTFPFYYQAHPLCKIASQRLQENLSEHALWGPYFNIDNRYDEYLTSKEQPLLPRNNGKMFGVLVVKNAQNELGYLSAFSGKNPFSQALDDFVPQVPLHAQKTKSLDESGEPAWFAESTLTINNINHQIETLEKTPELKQLEEKLNATKSQANEEISAHKVQLKAAKKSRDRQRDQAEKQLAKQDYLDFKKILSKESIQYKNQLRDLNTLWQAHISQDENALAVYTDQISALKSRRKALSTQLQQAIFNQYQFLNAQGEKQGLIELFASTITPEPPSGSGDCAAPKLLQYAYANQLTPITMAEFWWGDAPKSEIRQHKNFYSACQSKCKPILSHMLQGLAVDDNPLLINPAQGKALEYLYEDEYLVVINKPAEFLSVPGKDINDSVYTRVKEKYPQATGSIIVHRLDMSTSGIMVLALNARTHKGLQKQFIQRTVAKRYVALIDGRIEGHAKASSLNANSKNNENKLTESNEELSLTSGTIKLPLRVDLDDRPRQLVCYEYGKAAETFWEVCESKDENHLQNGSKTEKKTEKETEYTRLYLYPKTGRTHQLRVHCAHVLGLNTPIVGDDLYGTHARRLHLHAQQLSFEHPITREAMEFSVEPDF